jgi:hypothetical protein
MRESMMRARGRAASSKLAGFAAASLAIGALVAPTAAGNVQGSFAPTGSMMVGRSGAVAAPLPDGRVLVAGGVDPTVQTGSNVLQSAEIFDPATGTFSPTGSMTVPRVGAAAAPLPDGRVLIAGGDDQIQLAGALSSAEIFDPATGTFAPTGDMTILRNGPAAAPLPDGRVLVAGGSYRGPMFGEYLASAEIFDPRTGTFSPTGSMASPRTGAAAAPLPGGRALVVGGTGRSNPTCAADIFDTATGRFASVGCNVVKVGYPTAAPLPDGRAMVAGGSQLGTLGEAFDPVTGTFAWTDSMRIVRYGAAAAPLPDGRVLVAGSHLPLFGSQEEARAETQSAELFTPGFFYRLAGRRLTASVAVAGTLTAANAAVASAAGGRSRPSLKPARRKGGPGPISFKLTPTGKAKRRLEHTGNLRVRVRLSFVPKRVKGECVTEVSPCYSSSYAIHETVTLWLKAKKRR